MPRRFSAAFQAFTPRRAAVPGISWPRPRAPARETALERQADSTVTIDMMKRASRWVRHASAITERAYARAFSSGSLGLIVRRTAA